MKHVRLLFLLAWAVFAHAQAVPVRHVDGRLHGFVVLRSEDGREIGFGEATQWVHGSRVTYRMVYRFHDGSLDDETAIFTQNHTFQLVSDHHIQRGLFFPKPLDLTIEAGGRVTSRTVDGSGKPRVEVRQMDLPPGLVNGYLCSVLANLSPDAPVAKLAMVSPTEEPRLIHLDVSSDGQAGVSIAGARREAAVFRLKSELGGVAGVVAPLLGRQPADIVVWVLQGEAPAVVRATGQLTDDTPVIAIEMAGASDFGLPAKR